jgi:2-keto-3-deoxy-L-rhamnonate aldolase RhmA
MGTFSAGEGQERPKVRAKTTLRSNLLARDPIVATFVMIPRVEVLEMLGLAGYGAVIVDLEHGPIGVSDLPALAAFAEAAGLHSIARIAELLPHDIASVLDAGFDGVMVPHISSGPAAAEIVQAARFSPFGQRSLNPYVRGAAYDATTPERLVEFDSHAAVIGMLEGRDAIENLDAIVGVPGLDGVFVGPVDLSGELGFPGQPEHPEVLSTVSRVFSRCAEVGMAAGVYAPTPERADAWFERGASLVAVSADSAMMLDAFRTVRRRVRRGG